jgi:hypothetical protein
MVDEGGEELTVRSLDDLGPKHGPAELANHRIRPGRSH